MIWRAFSIHTSDGVGPCIAAATETAAVDAVVDRLLILAYRRHSFRILMDVASSTIKLTGMVLLIAGASTAFVSVFFNATGTHRANTPDGIETILGREVPRRFRIVQKDCGDAAGHRHVGITDGGIDISILGEFLDCDVKILTGFVEPQFFSGMSGGGKAVMPGLALLETIQRNHSAARMDHPKAIRSGRRYARRRSSPSQPFCSTWP